ncbi:uncharacterized protein PHALS_10584 [Plasmopara halstedii]|uniref:Uncharacterized protein n=1 Tax=Plasmopara halstedii TaxID=4781 RepID=A0A0P1AHH6_PLAHL|nr:uncharacterized protein PHALS_10584 [Plasmopara halstedii]CEG40380.1 hypothetical protein PHALS_10584 [Plasmopara halstedii]|eukprot:XP_024576749.1 hypothetical protein PHALS_10584 [Plasmopara halstedii]
MDDDLDDNDERMPLAVDISSVQHASPPHTEITHDKHLLSGRDAVVFHPPIHRRQSIHSQHHVLRDVPHTQQRLQVESDATPQRRTVVFEPVGKTISTITRNIWMGVHQSVYKLVMTMAWLHSWLMCQHHEATQSMESAKLIGSKLFIMRLIHSFATTHAML